ncbi:MAG TPA: peptidoglycan-binding protein [Candidatus Omnitrophota bacterium]|nr:peptidoglycan-binding protein [Candidatus Omnitrophota bacterium]
MHESNFLNKGGTIVELKLMKSLFALIFVFGLAGCATTRKEAAGDPMQMRITQLEEQLQQKDDEINDLKDQMQGLSEDVKKKDSYSRRSGGSATSNFSYKKDGILRVDVNPDQVQLALKNAGYYNGPVDGKIGEKTKRAVAEFQKAHNLNADGVIGKKTWNVLKTYLN